MSTRRERAKAHVTPVGVYEVQANKVILYVIGLFIAFTSLGVGMVLTDKKK